MPFHKKCLLITMVVFSFLKVNFQGIGSVLLLF